jgi:hypothetical protein
MAKTISQLNLATSVDDADLLAIEQGGVMKKAAASTVKDDCLRNVSGVMTMPDEVNIVFDTTTGSEIGTAADQKLAFYGATPVVQAAVTADLLDSLQALGFVASGAGDTPLDLSDGALGCGAVTATGALGCGAITSTGALSCTDATVDDLTVRDGKNVVLDTTTGTKIGTAATQKLGLWNVTPVVQPSAVAGIGVTYTANEPAAADGSITIANGNSVSNAELAHYVHELNAKVDAVLVALRAVGVIAAA